MARQAALEAYRANERQRQLDEARAEAEKARLDAERIRVQAAAAAQMAATEVLRLESEYSSSKPRLRRYTPVDPLVKKVDNDYEAKVAEHEEEIQTAREAKQRQHSRISKLVLQAVALVTMSAAIITITFAALSRQSVRQRAGYGCAADSTGY